MDASKERLRLLQRIDALNARWNVEMRGRHVPSPKAIRIKNEINETRKQVEAIDRDAAERLALEKPRSTKCSR